MDEHELKKKLAKLDVPPPSEGAKERAISHAKQAFRESQMKKERNSQGSSDSARLTSNPSLWEQLIRSLTMKKAYVFAGSFAAVAVVLTITTTHYSTIMDPVMITPKPETTTSTTPQPIEKKAVDKEAEVDDVAGAGTVNQNAPGMQGALVAAAPPPAKKAKESFAAADMAVSEEAMPAPGMMQKMAPSPSRRMASDAMMGGNVAGMMAPATPQALSIMPYPEPERHYGGDKFESHAANQNKLVSAEPVSTFSIDVDTASYSFVRSTLNQGRLPQAQMVRTEEMINYFDYNYPLPENKSEPFKPTVSVVPTPWNTSTKLVHIGIKGFDVAEKPRANLVFLIDVSGSMNQQNKLPLLKSSLKMLLDQLHPEDTIGIVTYAGRAGTALSPTKVANKQTIISVIDQLGTGGGTAGGAGIEHAYNLAAQNQRDDAVNRVILATDGDFNIGIRDPKQLQNFIEQKRETGVTLSVLGFGRGNYNDALMQKLAQHGNGNAAYIDTVNEARKVLVNEASSTLFTIAKDVKIQVEFNPHMISEYRLVGYESRMLKREDFNNDKVDAGDVGSGHAVTAIYEVTPVGAPGSVDELRYGKPAPQVEEVATSTFSNEYGFLKMRYKLPNENTSKLITTPITTGQEQVMRNASSDVRFSVAVAAFAQKLKGQSQLSAMSWDEIETLANGARGKDTFGYRAEFSHLVQTAKSLSMGGHSVQGGNCGAPGMRHCLN
ncbi:MAG: vWA domain-containing protein [Rickettsiales bacterium]